MFVLFSGFVTRPNIHIFIYISQISFNTRTNVNEQNPEQMKTGGGNTYPPFPCPHFSLIKRLACHKVKPATMLRHRYWFHLRAVFFVAPQRGPATLLTKEVGN